MFYKCVLRVYSMLEMEKRNLICLDEFKGKLNNKSNLIW